MLPSGKLEVDGAQRDVEAAKCVVASPARPEMAESYPWRRHILRSYGVGARTLVPCGPYGCLTYVNVIFILACFAFFVVNAVIIISSFVDDVRSPPMNMKISFNEAIPMPPMLVCNSIPRTDFGRATRLVLTYVDDSLSSCVDSFTSATAAGPRATVLRPSRYRCDHVFPNVTVQQRRISHSYLDRYETLHETWLGCMEIVGLPGWSDQPGTAHKFPNKLLLDLRMNFSAIEHDASSDFNADAYSTFYSLSDEEASADYFGADLFLFEDASDLQKANTSTELRLMSAGYTILAGGLYHSASLTLSRVSYLESSGTADYQQYQIELSSATLNPNTFERLQVELSYGDARVFTTEQRRVSFSTYFGSLGGWLGLLSDGWGILSIVFILERCLLLRTGRRRYADWHEVGADPATPTPPPTTALAA